jgi:hypothetical protein
MNSITIEATGERAACYDCKAETGYKITRHIKPGEAACLAKPISNCSTCISERWRVEAGQLPSEGCREAFAVDPWLRLPAVRKSKAAGLEGILHK